MDIFLVRHAEAAASWGESSDPGLSAVGWQQAVETAELLWPQLRGDTVLLSSPLLRARQTAEPLAEKSGRPVQDAEVFREIPAPVPLAQRQAWLRQFMDQEWHQQCDDLLLWRNMAIEHLKMLQQPAVIFTHFLVINAVVGQVLGRPETRCFWPDNGSITRMRLNGSALELLELGREMTTIVN